MIENIEAILRKKLLIVVDMASLYTSNSTNGFFVINVVSVLGNILELINQKTVFCLRDTSSFSFRRMFWI